MAVTFPVAQHAGSSSERRDAAARQAPGHLKLTRRGRIVVVLGTLAVLLLVGFTVGRVSASKAAGTDAPRTTVVQAGDTLWGIAAKAAPNRDPRAVVSDIERLNRLSSTSLVPGAQLVLPS